MVEILWLRRCFLQWERGYRWRDFDFGVNFSAGGEMVPQKFCGYVSGFFNSWVEGFGVDFVITRVSSADSADFVLVIFIVLI